MENRLEIMDCLSCFIIKTIFISCSTTISVLTLVSFSCCSPCFLPVIYTSIITRSLSLFFHFPAPEVLFDRIMYFRSTHCFCITDCEVQCSFSYNSKWRASHIHPYQETSNEIFIVKFIILCLSII